MSDQVYTKDEAFTMAASRLLMSVYLDRYPTSQEVSLLSEVEIGPGKVVFTLEIKEKE
jgi:hypothetical protein